MDMNHTSIYNESICMNTGITIFHKIDEIFRLTMIEDSALKFVTTLK